MNEFYCVRPFIAIDLISNIHLTIESGSCWNYDMYLQTVQSNRLDIDINVNE